MATVIMAAMTTHLFKLDEGTGYCLIHGCISLPKTVLRKYLPSELMTAFSIFHFLSNHPVWKFILYPVSIGPMPALLCSSEPHFHFFSFSQWLHPLLYRTLKKGYCNSSSWANSVPLGFLFPTHKPKRSGFCPTTQLKLFPTVNVNSQIGKPDYLSLDFILLDLLETQDTLVTSGLLKLHPLAAGLYPPTVFWPYRVYILVGFLPFFYVSPSVDQVLIPSSPSLHWFLPFQLLRNMGTSTWIVSSHLDSLLP